MALKNATLSQRTRSKINKTFNTHTHTALELIYKGDILFFLKSDTTDH